MVGPKVYRIILDSTVYEVKAKSRVEAMRKVLEKQNPQDKQIRVKIGHEEFVVEDPVLLAQLEAIKAKLRKP